MKANSTSVPCQVMLRTAIDLTCSKAKPDNECGLQALQRGTSERVVHAAEPSLISWDEIEAPEDVYQAVTLADGRPALIKGRSGEVIRIHRRFKSFMLETGLEARSYCTALHCTA